MVPAGVAQGVANLRYEHVVVSITRTPPLPYSLRETDWRGGVLPVYTVLMAAFEDALSQLRGWDGSGESAPPDQLWNDLATAYQAVVDQRDGAAKLLIDSAAVKDGLTQEVARLKGENYDLASRIGFKTEDPPAGDETNKRPTGIDGLFVRRNK